MRHEMEQFKIRLLSQMVQRNCKEFISIDNNLSAELSVWIVAQQHENKLFSMTLLFEFSGNF